MTVSAALRSAAKNAPDAVQAALRRAKSLFGNFTYNAAKVDVGDQKKLISALSDADQAKSFDDAIDTVNDIPDGSPTSHIPSPGPGETPKTYVKGEAPPEKDPTTDMPDGPPKVNARWAQISKFIKNNKGSIGTTVLAGVGIGTWMAVAGVYLQNTDGVEVKITKIENVKDKPKQYKFTYSTQGGQTCGPSGAKVPCIQSAFTPCKDDTFTFRSTHTTPTLDDVTALVIDVDDNAVYFELDLTNIGNGTPEWGFMTCHTSFRNQFRGTVRDAVHLVADLAGDVATPLLGGFCDAIPIPFICTGFDFSNWTVWVCIICLLMCCAGLLLLAFS